MLLMSHAIDPEWHESLLVIRVMNECPVPRRKLFDIVRERQSKKKVLGAEGITHSRKAYAHWLKEHINYRIAVDSERVPRLTALGKWIANSRIGTLDDRYLFVCNLTCSHCRKEDGCTVFLKLEKDTATIDVKGRVLMDTQCPRCGRHKKRKAMLEGFSIKQVITFYDRALPELDRAVKDMPKVILPELPEELAATLCWGL